MANPDKAQEKIKGRVNKEVAKGTKERVLPKIKELSEEITQEVLGIYKFFDGEPDIADLNKKIKRKGKTATIKSHLKTGIARSYNKGKGKIDKSVLGVSGGAYRQSAVELNFILSSVIDRDIPLPNKSQYFNAQLADVGGLKITERQGLNTRKEFDRLVRLIFSGIQDGQSPAQMADNITRAMKLTEVNVLRIVRTESARMMNAGSYDQTVAARKLGIKTRRKIISTLDDRTRPQSAAVDGLLETLTEDGEGYFEYQGVRAKYPGDWGVAAWDINDREDTIDILLDENDQPLFEESQTRSARDIEVGPNGNPIVGRTKSGKPIEAKSIDIKYTDFQQWAKDRGLVKNRYGQVLFPE
jgi:hypothetical protein